MNMATYKSARTHFVVLVFSLLAALPLVAVAEEPSQVSVKHEPTHLYIVQAQTMGEAEQLAVDAGGRIVKKLNIINAVGVELSQAKAAELRDSSGVRVYKDRELETQGRRSRRPEKETDTTALVAESDEFLRSSSSDGILQMSELQRTLSSVVYEHPLIVDAPAVHKVYEPGTGVTVAVIDTGLWWEADTVLAKSPIARIDVTGEDLADDPHGHGTHVASIIASDRYASNFIFEGIAPRANILAVRAFRADGSGTYLDVIDAIQRVVAVKDDYNVRVMNLSFSASPQSHYWDDPLNQAVMAAWKAGIVVVVSAGNSGPTPMSIGVPGNVPYVITVGAMSDNFSTVDATDDPLTSFSSVGPTYEGFIKPEVVAPGGHIVSSMPFDSYIGTTHPDSMVDSDRHFAMSGTSQAAAIVSGIAALMVSEDSSLSPDDIKCRLMSTARPAVNDDGSLAYSVFQQGAGLVNALDAVQSGATDCANQGLNLSKDLAGRSHYGGPANQDSSGNYYIRDDDGDPLDADGYTWSQGYVWSRGYVWSQAYLWSEGYVWSRAYLWSESYLWSRSIPWIDSVVFPNGLAEPMGVNHWVNHE